MNDVEIARRREALKKRLARGVDRLRPADAVQAAATAVPDAVSRPLRGGLQLPYFSAPVDVSTDRFGVPHVVAASRADLYRAQGFLQVADRGWQIELNARRALGTLAELLGPAALSSDQFVHRIGLPDAVRRAVTAMPAETWQVFEWYAEGQRTAAELIGATAEHALLHAEPTVPDTETALVRATALFMLLTVRLQHDWFYELLRLSITATDRADADRTPYSPSVEQLLQAYRKRFGSVRTTGGGGSNAWAVSGPRSATGGAVLAGDPHLEQQLPGNWYAMHLACPGVDVIGASLPGVPDILFGHNGKVGWANTFAPVVSTECVIEHLIGPGVVRRPDGTEPVRTRSVRIAIAGEEDHTEECASTSNGPLLGLALTAPDGSAYDLALRFAAWDEPYPQPVIAAANTAKTGNQLASILSGWRGMAQSVVYADHQGGIGVVQTGVRLASNAREPRCGWRPGTRAAVVPRHDVVRGNDIVVSANNLPDGSAEPGHWEVALRANRIRDLLDDGVAVPFNQSVRTQLDVLSPLALRVLPALCAGVAAHVNGLDAELLTDLSRWHGFAYRDLVEPTVFAAWYRRLASAAAGDELGELFFGSKAWLTEWGLETVDRWVDARGHLPDGARELAGHYRAALADLRGRLGPDPARWAWGRVHRVRFGHALTGLPGWPAEDVVLELPGLDDSVFRGDTGVDPVGGPTFRMVLNLAEPDRSVWAWPVGNSGVATSPHWADSKDSWAQGRYYPMPFSRAAVNAASTNVLRIVPSRKAPADR
ncbi:penicillin acylase family protein [Nocardia gipuzkoensis]|nr:penicillin acylase family protein [Nocardia abscessus]